MSIGPEVSVKLVLRVGGRVMMLRRHDTGRYNFPGGHVQRNERLLDALRRELREELGYNLRNTPRFFDLHEHIEPDGSQHIIILHYLLVLEIRPAFALGDDEAESEILWLSRDELAAVVPDQDFIEKIFTNV